MKLSSAEIRLRTNFFRAFNCLRELGFRRRRFHATAHEYEVWFYDSLRGRAVRLTLERQWSYRYLYVLFLQRDSQKNVWVPLGYLDAWLAERGWSQREIHAVFEASLPVPNMSDQEQLVFLSSVASIVCSSVSSFGQERLSEETET